jgi:hypothetical protein
MKRDDNLAFVCDETVCTAKRNLVNAWRERGNSVQRNSNEIKQARIKIFEYKTEKKNCSQKKKHLQYLHILFSLFSCFQRFSSYLMTIVLVSLYIWITSHSELFFLQFTRISHFRNRTSSYL